MTKNIVIKILVVVLSISLYFNVSQIITNKELQKNETVLQDLISDLEDKQDQMQSQIDDLLDGNQVDETCNKLFDIVIVVVSASDNLNKSVNLCTNEPYLGDAIDEIQEELDLEYDPRYDKDYVYGRMAVSFYGVTAEVGEYFQITINGEYSNYGIDKVLIEDETNYEFTLVVWQ